MACLSRDAESPEVVWNERMRRELATRVAQLAAAARTQQVWCDPTFGLLSLESCSGYCHRSSCLVKLSWL